MNTRLIAPHYCHLFKQQKERLIGMAVAVCVMAALFVSPQVTADDELRNVIRQTMQNATFPALITVDEEGQPRARTVDAFAPDENLVVWIATRPVTRKVQQIRNHSKVTLYYWHQDTSSYVTLMGQASLVNDTATKERLRRPQDGDRFYPDFPDDYLLIKVEPDYLEAIVPGYRGDKITWRPARLDVDT